MIQETQPNFSEKKEQIPAGNFDVLTPMAFLTDFKIETITAKERVWGKSMYLDYGPTMQQLVDVFKAAGPRVNTRMRLDSIVFTVTEGRFNWLPRTTEQRKSMAFQRHHMYRLRQEMRNAHVDVSFSNPPTPLDVAFPPHGRDHRKSTLVDSKAVYLGDFNYGEPLFDDISFAMKFTQPEVVQAVANEFEKDISGNDGKKDYVVNCTPDIQLLVDAGIHGRSLIIDEAAKRIAAAKKNVRILMPYAPDGKIKRALLEAKENGIDLEIIIAPSHKIGGFYSVVNTITRLTDGKGMDQLPVEEYPHELHAKLVIVDDEIAIFGSNNFTNKGPLMGTKEMDVLLKNKEGVGNLVQFVEWVKAMRPHYEKLAA